MPRTVGQGGCEVSPKKSVRHSLSRRQLHLKKSMSMTQIGYRRGLMVQDLVFGVRSTLNPSRANSIAPSGEF